MKCFKCLERFDFVNDLLNHLKNVENIEEYDTKLILPCTIHGCDSKVVTFPEYKEHLAEYHGLREHSKKQKTSGEFEEKPKDEPKRFSQALTDLENGLEELFTQLTNSAIPQTCQNVLAKSLRSFVGTVGELYGAAIHEHSDAAEDYVASTTFLIQHNFQAILSKCRRQTFFELQKDSVEPLQYESDSD